MPPTETPWLTVADAAEYAQCSMWSVYRAVQSGALKGHKRGATARSHWRFRVEDLDAWLAGPATPRARKRRSA